MADQSSRFIHVAEQFGSGLFARDPTLWLVCLTSIPILPPLHRLFPHYQPFRHFVGFFSLIPHEWSPRDECGPPQTNHFPSHFPPTWLNGSLAGHTSCPSIEHFSVFLSLKIELISKLFQVASLSGVSVGSHSQSKCHLHFFFFWEETFRFSRNASAIKQQQQPQRQHPHHHHNNKNYKTTK